MFDFIWIGRKCEYLFEIIRDFEREGKMILMALKKKFINTILE